MGSECCRLVSENVLWRHALQENLHATPTRTRPLALRTGYDARARGAISGRLNAAGWRAPERRHERPDGYRRTGLLSLLVGDCRVVGQGFEFLGYRFEAGQRWVRKRSLMSLRDNIRAKTKRNEGNSIAYVIAALNPTLRGWYGYFQHAHRFTFTSIDGFVRRRLRALLRRQKHRPGQGQC